MPLSITHSRFRKVLAEFQQLSSVLSWSPLAPVLNPFNQDSYNNLWSPQLATWLSTWGCIYRQSEVGNGVIYILKSAFPPCLKSLVRCLLNSRVTVMVSLLCHTFIHSFTLSLIISRHLTQYSLDASERRSKKRVDFFLSVWIWSLRLLHQGHLHLSDSSASDVLFISLSTNKYMKSKQFLISKIDTNIFISQKSKKETGDSSIYFFINVSTVSPRE